jgi:hypothetical protein
MKIPEITFTSPTPPTSPSLSTIFEDMGQLKDWPDHEYMVEYPPAGKINKQSWAMLEKYWKKLGEAKAKDVLAMMKKALVFRHLHDNGMAFFEDPGDFYKEVASCLKELLLHPCWYTAIEQPSRQAQCDFYWHYDWLKKREEELSKFANFS